MNNNNEIINNIREIYRTSPAHKNTPIDSKTFYTIHRRKKR
jgi:hypothetical protein